jgi:hypothetical protein
MAERLIVSPGVFTNEIDKSFLAQGVANIGGAIVGPFASGPGFAPTLINNQVDLEEIFGKPDGTYYAPYAAQQYLQEQGTVTIVRVGGLGGYHQKDPLLICAKRGDYTRENLTSDVNLFCFTGSIHTGSSSTYQDGYIHGFMAVKFLSGPLSGSLYEIGSFSASFDSGSVEEVSGAFSVGSVSAIITGSGNTLRFDDSLLVGDFFINSNNLIRFSGSLSGNYGEFDPSTFISSSYSRDDDKILAVLANTAYDSGQLWEGFDGSVLTPLTTESITVNYNLHLKEVDYTDSTDGILDGMPTSSYGFYDFSLDRSSPFFITNVFGTDPRQGQSLLPAGWNPKAAYVYKVFEAAIDQVVGEMLTDGKWKIEVCPGDGLVLNEQIVDCIPDAVEDQPEYVTSFAMKFQDDIPGGGSTTAPRSAYDLRQAETSWILSQNSSPGSTTETRFELFKFHTLSDGTDQNQKYKVEITNIKLAGTVPGSDYGTFDIILRQFDDSDVRPLFVESFTQCSLDPNSSNYIARKIGDKWYDINPDGKILEYGEFSNKSKHIRIEMTAAPYPNTVVPFGFQPYATPIGGVHTTNIPVMQYTIASIYSKNVGKYASGVDFVGSPTNADEELTNLYPATNARLDNYQYFAPVPQNSTIGKNTPFSLDKTCGLSAVLNLGTEKSEIKKRRFVLGFQHGFDGLAPQTPILLGNDILPTNQQGLDCSTITASGSIAYSQAIGALGNSDEFDINLVALPGINYNQHPYVSELTIEMCERRGDCFYIADLFENQMAGGNSISNIVNKAAELDTNYAATYYPWIKILDTNTNRQINVPPSVVMPAIYAQSDRVSAEWFAPAGLNRGGIPQAVGVNDRLTFSDRDDLYEGKVNPIAQFPGQGVVVWGQKTLQSKPSALDRVNVRRLLIALKKFIASSSRFLVFEQNVSVTRNRFLSIVNPYLESVQQRSGLYAFRVVMDETNNTPDVIDRNILKGDIYLQPTKTAEFIVLDFVVLPTGASFGN